MTTSYGNLNFHHYDDKNDILVEEVLLKGYTILHEVLTQPEISKLKTSILGIYEKQELHFSNYQLTKINDLSMARCLLKYDFKLFSQLAFNKLVLDLVKRLINQKFILGLQNGIINLGDNHNQSNWHRDLPYQNFVCNEIISLNALWALDNFTEINGGTCILPYSTHFNTTPSQEFINNHFIQPNLNAGDVLIFNSMLLHKAGINNTTNPRISINHQYIRPFIQPQYKFYKMPAIIKHVIDDEQKSILGFNFKDAIDDIEWRQYKLDKIEHA